MTYPNVLVMGYLKEAGQLTPEWKAKLDAAISTGWQRLLTFEVQGGGFDWYGRAPAKTILTAYGILELTDMNKVYPIDLAVVDRARDVLYRRQQPDGSWHLDIPMHTWHQLGGAQLPITAYVVWALRSAGYTDAQVQRGAEYVRAHRAEAKDPYVQALVALALGDAASAATLEASALREKDATFWTTAGEGLCHARGDCAAIEATALAALGLRESRAGVADEALTWLARMKDPAGSWHSTQATILCIKALLEASKAPGSPQPVLVRLRVNGRDIPAAFAPVGGDNRDVVQQVEIPVAEGENVVELTCDGDLRATFQVAGRWYAPWADVPPAGASPLRIDTVYDRTELDLTDRLGAVTTLRYTGTETFMVIADLGIPPGFSPDTASFEALVRDGVIDKYSLGARQITLYFGRVAPGKDIRIAYDLLPRFPVVAQSPRSRAYEYYSPQNEAGAAPRKITVRNR